MTIATESLSASRECTTSSSIVPIRVDALSEDKTIRIVDTLLFDPTCWPISLYQPLHTSVEENVVHIAHTILSDAEVQVRLLFVFEKHTFWTILVFFRSTFVFVICIHIINRVWEEPFDILRDDWIYGIPNSKRPLRISFGHNSGRLPPTTLLLVSRHPKTPTATRQPHTCYLYQFV